VDSSLPFALTDCPASYCAAQIQFELRSRLLQQNKAATVTCVAPQTARAIHLASPVINKKKWKEIVFLPCLLCLQRNGSVNKEYDLQEGREMSMIKLSL